MPGVTGRKLSLSRSIGASLRWPLGVLLTSWRYMWRTTPFRRVEEAGSWPEDAPPPLPGAVLDEQVQRISDGSGVFYHRRYVARIRDAALSPEELIGRLQGDPDRAAPTEFATFKKVVGDSDGVMRPGDEFVVRMPGPWDGPVRVVEATPRCFRLATLSGHLEAGQIAFRAEGADGHIHFEIESWARAGDRLSALLYDRLRMSKETQLHMWTSFLERVLRLSGGARDGRLEIKTRRVEELPDVV
jgi:Domain of unknown function (DUF1990)